MATTTTSYSDWMQQNPEIVNQAANRMGGGAPQIAPASNQQPQMAPPPQAPVYQQPTQQPANSIGSQLRDPYETPKSGGVKPEGESVEVIPPKDTGQHGMEGVMGIAKMVASIYTGGATAAASSAATSGAQNRQTDAQGNQQGGNQAGGIMSMLGGFMGGK